MDDILDLLTDFISSVVSWLYGLIFIDSKEFIKSLGNSIFNFFVSLMGGNIFSADLLIFICGLIVFVFLVKLSIRVIRG